MPPIGVISDTHGLLRPEALAALAGSELILHAGDIGAPSVIEGLGDIAVVHAIRGNVDRADWAQPYPETRNVDIHGLRIHVVHDVNGLDPDILEHGVDAVVSGHSHKPAVDHRNGILFFNPGSAGPRRFTLPVCVGRLHFDGNTLRAEVIELEI